jgi:hypothetical protein
MNTPASPPKPPLEDPLQEREIFATEVSGVGGVHGNIAITLACVRFDEPTANEPPKARRVVTGRLMLTQPAALQLLQSLQQLVAAAQPKQPTAGVEKPN